MISSVDQRAKTNAKTERMVQALHRACDALVWLFCRFVTGRIVIEAVTQAVVKYAWVQMQNTEPDTERMQKTSLTRMAMFSGLDTRIIRKYLNEPMRAQEEHLSIESAILSAWAKDPSLRSPRTGRLINIPIFGAWGTFEGFVQRYAGRGVSVRYVLERLVKYGYVKEINKHFVRLISSEWIAFKHNEDDALYCVAGNIEKLSRAALHNIQHMAEPEKKWIERSRFSYSIAKKHHKAVEEALNQLLIKCWEEAGKIYREYESKSNGDTVDEELIDEIGIGFYYWDGAHPATPDGVHFVDGFVRFSPWRDDNPNPQ